MNELFPGGPLIAHPEGCQREVPLFVLRETRRIVDLHRFAEIFQL